MNHVDTTLATWTDTTQTTWTPHGPDASPTSASLQDLYGFPLTVGCMAFGRSKTAQIFSSEATHIATNPTRRSVHSLASLAEELMVLDGGAFVHLDTFFLLHLDTGCHRHPHSCPGCYVASSDDSKKVLFYTKAKNIFCQESRGFQS